MKTDGLTQLHTAVVLFGLAGLFGKLLALSPLLIVGGRTFFAAVTLALTLCYLGQSIRVKTWHELLALFLCGCVLAFHWYAFFQSIQLSTVAIGLITFSTFPLFVTFMEPYFFGEPLRLFDILTAIGVLAGLLLVTPSFDIGDQITLGVIWGVLSGLSFAILSLLNRSSVTRSSPLLIGCYQNLFATVALLPFVVSLDWHLTLYELALLCVLGVLCTAIAHVLFIASLAHIRAQLASVVTTLEPLYGAIFAVVLLGEIPTVRTLLGGMIILGATLIAVRFRPRLS